MAIKTSKKRTVQKRQNPLLLIALIVALLALLSGVIGYFILQQSESGQGTEPAKAATETPMEREPQITIEPPYTGTWVSNYDGAILTLKRFSFTLEMPSVDNTTKIEGELSVVKNVLTFVNTGGTETCRGVEGHYQYTFEDSGDIVFKKIKDNCKSRAERMAASWFRL